MVKSQKTYQNSVQYNMQNYAHKLKRKNIFIYMYVISIHHISMYIDWYAHFGISRVK